ncbi:RagB/SusD family nutrient uptake outer membrane protein [uncultured Bacteroides sp.]|uniref:RagB/SusD family nutrient uptake outer membrane protein n=1 Tax=uncultured Bacteroides sp. TaxID=162156 RepID=UPI002AA86B21|nr:RagB/SusD family nutrient uptake outer membrane protein [uncultured Bacteroides sp.]
MKKIIDKAVFAAICGAMLSLASCISDLDTVPLTDNVLLPETAWANQDTYAQFVAKIYAGFALSGNEGPSGMPDIVGSDQGEATFLRSYWNLQELPTDEAVIAWSDDGLNGLQFNQWTSSNRFCELNYNRMLLNVAFCNEYLRQTTPDVLDTRGVDETMKSKIETYRYEVRTLRAMNYYFLIDLFGSVPYITENDGVGSYLPEQKDRTFLFPWIESELKACEGHLPAKSAENYGKVNDPTVWMLLAKMYLNAEVYIGENRYTDCLTYLNKIMTTGYSLDKTYKNMFGADNNKSSEIIFPIAFDGKSATSYGGTTYLMAAAYGSDMDPGTNFGLAQSWSGVRSSEALTSLFDENDKRGLFWKDKRTQATTQWSDYNSGWAVIKYTNMNSDGTPGSDNVFPDTDFPMYRLADAYLMYAEAVLRGGEGGSKSQALSYVNDLRIRAGINIIGDSDLTLQFILDERARELYWEGHRRTDLIRFSFFTKSYAWPWKNGVYAGTANIDDKYNLYPIPAAEMVANPNMKQNPGF